MTNAYGLDRFLLLSGQTGTYELCITGMGKEGYVYNPGGDEMPACQSMVVEQGRPHKI